MTDSSSQAPQPPAADAASDQPASPGSSHLHQVLVLVASAAVVAVITLVLLLLQGTLEKVENIYLRPYGVAFVLGIAAITTWAGTIPGIVTSGMSVLAFVFVLIPLSEKRSDIRPSDAVELCLLITVGVVVVVSIHLARQEKERASRAHQEAEEARARLQAILDAAPVAVLTCDATGKLEYASAEAERIWGQPFAQVGVEGYRRFHLLALDGTPLPPERTGLVRALKQEGELVQNELIVQRPDGSLVWVISRSTTIRASTPRGAVTRGAVTAFIDVTREREVEAERQRLLQTLLLHRPETVPGLEIATYYAPAHEEVRVGGDFYDIYPLDSARTVLAIGDMSGKGVAAAAQVTMVRHMLRYALFQGKNLAGSVDELNSVLSGRRLLSGFATLFIGVYDSGSGQLEYVSCGHEAGLLYRAGSGAVEELPPTGPIIGVFPTAAYTQRQVLLGEGDLLTLYTDGISETGRSRLEFLGASGFSRWLQELAGEKMQLEALLERLLNRAPRMTTGVSSWCVGVVRTVFLRRFSPEPVFFRGMALSLLSWRQGTPKIYQ